jgi:hypothetical protein
MDDAEIAVIGRGFYKLSCEKRRKLRKTAEILMLAQKTKLKPYEPVQNPDIDRKK